MLGAAYCTGRYGVEAEAAVAGCLESRGYTPVRGFGSTDDPSSSHLYRAPQAKSLRGLLRDSLECLRQATGPGLCGTIQLLESED